MVIVGVVVVLVERWINISKVARELENHDQSPTP